MDVINIEIENLKRELIKIKEDLNYLMKMQRERELRISKFFIYDSTDSE